MGIYCAGLRVALPRLYAAVTRMTRQTTTTTAPAPTAQVAC